MVHGQLSNMFCQNVAGLDFLLSDPGPVLPTVEGGKGHMVYHPHTHGTHYLMAKQWQGQLSRDGALGAASPEPHSHPPESALHYACQARHIAYSPKCCNCDGAELCL